MEPMFPRSKPGNFYSHSCWTIIFLGKDGDAFDRGCAFKYSNSFFGGGDDSQRLRSGVGGGEGGGGGRELAGEFEREAV